MTVLEEKSTEPLLDATLKGLPPGATIGLFGSGQLGRMFTQAAQQLGYRVCVFSPTKNSPTAQVANAEVVAEYSDRDAVERFARCTDVITLEFENVPTKTVEWASAIVPVRPSANVLSTVQHRVKEKEFLVNAGVPTTPFREIRSLDGLYQAIQEIGSPAVLKTSVEGYDGKGQTRITSANQVEDAWKLLSTNDAILEGFVDFECEFSVLTARGINDSCATIGPIANAHQNHILDISKMPDPGLEDVKQLAIETTQQITRALDVVGIICVEFFLTRTRELLVNEIAPRPHNSGHLTLNAHATSQFEQQVRAVCGLPLGSPKQLQPAAMANLLGDLWQQGEPNWAAALAIPGVSLHLYGKQEARPGRKMGHLTAVADTTVEAESLVTQARAAINK